MTFKDDFQINKRLDDLFYFKFINTQVGFGVFSKYDLKENILIGEYTGMI